jgi:hypothetical protein
MMLATGTGAEVQIPTRGLLDFGCRFNAFDRV